MLSNTVSVGINYIPDVGADLAIVTNKLKQFVAECVHHKKYKQALKELKKYSEQNTEVSFDTVMYLMGKVYYEAGDYQSAFNCYTNGIAHTKKSYDLWMGLSELYLHTAKYGEAIVAINNALEIKKDALTYRALGEAYLNAGGLEEASVSLLAAIEQDKNDYVSWYQAASTLTAQGRHDVGLQAADIAVDYLRHKTKNKKPFSKTDTDIFASLAFMRMSTKEGKDSFKALGEWSEHYHGFCARGYREEGKILEHPEVRPITFNKANVPSRKIRVGFIGGDFFNHVTCTIYGRTLMSYDRAQFLPFIYHTGHTQDDWTKDYQDNSHFYRHLHGFSSQEIADIIRKDKIDVLVDMSGVTKDNNLLVFASRPAPVQLTGLGFIHPVNQPFMDGIITDPNALPFRLRRHTHEKAYDVDCIMHYDGPIKFVPDEVDTHPHKNGQPFTFGSANNLYKLTPQVLRTWAAIIKRCPGSRLMLKAKQFECHFTWQRVMEFLTNECGLETHQIMTKGQTFSKEHTECFNDIDIYLDPFPYQGGVTACEAMYMGAPAVVMDGGTGTATSAAVSTPGASVVAYDVNDYINKAVNLKHQMVGGAYSRPEVKKALRQGPVMSQDHYWQVWGCIKQALADYLQAQANAHPIVE